MAAVEEAPPTEPTEPTEPASPQTDEPPEDDDASARKAAAADGSDDLTVKAGAAQRDYRRKLGRIFGSTVTLYDCATCEGRGVLFTPPEDDGVPSDVKQAENLEICEHCNGYGLNLTPSKNPDHATAVCTKCSGIGYVVKTAAAAPYVPPTAPEAAPDAPIGGVWSPGRGFIPYGQTEPLPNTVGLA